MDKELLITVAQEFASRKIIIEPESEIEAKKFLDGCWQAGVIDKYRREMYEVTYVENARRRGDAMCFRSDPADHSYPVKYGMLAFYKTRPEYRDYELVKYSDFVESVCGVEEECDVSGFDEIINTMI